MNIKEIILTERVLHPYTPAGKEAIRMMEPVVQTTADAARAGANELTYGHYDKGAAAANATIKGTDYDTELKKQYAKSAEAEKRSPIASEVGRVASYAVPVGAAAVGAKLAVKGATKILPKTLNTATKTGKAISIGSKGGAGITGGVAGDVAAKEIATQFDPNNPHLEENLFARAAKAGLNFLQKDVRGTAASGAKANKLNTAAGQTPAPGSLKPPTMTGGQGPTSPVPQPAITPKTSPTDSERISKLEKQVNPSFGTKVANYAKGVAATTAGLGALGGIGYYAGAPAVKKYAFSPADDSPHTNKYDKSDYTTKWKAAQAEKEKQEAEADAKSQEQNLNLHSRPQSTDTDNGGTFSRDTFKESSTELERVKYLTQYRS
jgi:hypothetical protein